MRKRQQRFLIALGFDGFDAVGMVRTEACITDQLDFITGREGLEAVALRVHKAEQKLIGPRAAHHAQMRAMHIDWIVVSAGHFAIFDLDQAPAAGEMQQVCPAGASAAGAGTRGERHMVESEVLAELRDDAQTVQEAKGAIPPGDVLAAQDENTHTVPKGLAELEHAAGGESGIAAEEQAQLERCAFLCLRHVA